MMNRSTQKELIKLMLQLNEMWPQLDLSNTEQQNMVLDILNTVSTKCQKDFSKVNADRYVDTVESLGNVIKLTDWQHMASEELNQCLSLCQEIMLQVINNLRNEKELKKDIVFLPYKASMWDSLESVWKAAYEDKEHCNTYVIPIPYCDRNPDGSVAQWHCEIGEYPDYVPVLDFRKYSGEYLEEMHPDAIFIHNPYDKYNRVTSVDEQYYSSNLRKYTSSLIYIPYFVTEINVDPGKVNSPGVINANHVILQDEIIGSWYKKIYCYPKDNSKFLILGSPKVDKVRSINKLQYPISKKWEKILAQKKYIFFFNTTLRGLFSNDSRYLYNLEVLFDIVAKSNEIMLWWRPHPLFEATLKAMYPNKYSEYNKLKNKFINKKIGIYDELPVFYNGFAWTDAYYGDPSSLYLLYKCTEKPAYVIDWKGNLDKNIGVLFNELIDEIKYGTKKRDRNINDTVPQDAGLNVYRWLKSTWEDFR